MRLKIMIPTLMLFSLMMLTQTLVPAGAWTSDDNVFDGFGPRDDYFVMNLYGTTDALMGALQAGEIDVAGSVVPGEWEEAWSAPPYNDPNDPDYIKMQPVKSVGQREFDLNHKETIDTYPDHTNPMTYQKFRQAIAHATNKPEYVAEILEGRAVVLCTPIMPWTVWYNHLCSDYYTYDMSLARLALNTGGFTEGTTGPLVEGGDNVRVYPTGHEHAGADLDPIILYIRADDPDRIEAGKRIAAKLKELGISTIDNILPMSGCYNPVFIVQDYHLYTGGWDLSFVPDYLYDLYGSHAINWPNYLYYDNSAYDEASSRVKYAADFDIALQGALDAQMIITEDVGYIPLWTAVAQTAHRGYDDRNTNKPWEGFVNAEGVGLHSWWSFLSAHTGDAARGSPITKGVVGDIMKLNPLRSSSISPVELEILDKVYDTLLKENPFTGGKIPWEAHGWHAGTYYNHELGRACTMLTFNLEDDIYWHDGVHFTSADVKFSIEYHRDMGSMEWGRNVEDVYDVKTVDDYTVVVLMSVTSLWALNWIGELPMIPKHIWENIGPDEVEEDMPDPYLIGTGPFKYEGGEAGTEPGTGIPPKVYAKMSAYSGFFRYCSIKAAGGIDLQGSYTLPAGKNLMKRTVYGPNDMYGVSVHPNLNTIVPRITCKNHHATTIPPWTGTWTLTTTGYIDSKAIIVASSGPPVTMTFNTFSIAGDLNGALPYTFSASHTADPETGRACSYTQDNLIKTFIGDINGDGVLDLFDVLELNVAFVLDIHGGKYYANADINGDGSIDIFDAIEMSWYLSWYP